MSNNANDKAAAIAALQQINQVEGFDPTPLAVEFNDLNTQEKRLRLPVNVQMGWFRKKYPEGKITVEPKAGDGYTVAHARVYAHYNDPKENFLAEGTAVRGRDANKPTISPLEWAQTAAIGMALRYAGFGLSFDAAGDGFDHNAVDALGADVQFTPGAGAAPPVSTAPSTTDVPFGVAPDVPLAAETASPVTGALSVPEIPSSPAEPEPQYSPPVTHAAPAPQQAPIDLAGALGMPCPTKQYAGKTLGEVMQFDPECINWVAQKFKKDPAIAEGARLICEHALSQASA